MFFFLTIFFQSDVYGDNLFYLNFTVKIQKCTNFIPFKAITLY